jgi:hypothetical protein
MAEDKQKKRTFLGISVSDMIQRIAHHVDAGEYNNDPLEFREARRLLNNQLPQLIDQWVVEERMEAYQLGMQTVREIPGVDQLVETFREKENPLPVGGGSKVIGV